jgi:hypothetical protein
MGAVVVLHVASRRGEHLPRGQLHATVGDADRTLCGLRLGDGLVILVALTWEGVGDDDFRCSLCVTGAGSFGGDLG